jgi:23S rRNA (adenine2503-C2)-methyltransferase
MIVEHPGLKETGFERVDIRSLDLKGLETFVESLGQPSYRAKQLYKWIHQAGVRSFDEMTNISKVFREQLSERAHVTALNIDKVQKAKDGTRKYAFRTSHQDVIESVFIPNASAKGRNTLCISSQVGCALDCTFCLTASLGLRRNLGGGEIAEQLIRVKQDLGSSIPIQNIVMMGMGEPLHNYKNLILALEIINSEMGHNVSPRRITVSTAGLVPKIGALGRDTRVCLAVSLNATTDTVRDQIMPINKKWNIEALLNACKAFPLEQRRRITFEYVLLKGINDSMEDARRLAKLLQPFRCKINVIPFNEHPQSPYQSPNAQAVEDFVAFLRSKHLTTFVRTPRGEDISAACGQLGVETANSRLPVVQE